MRYILKIFAGIILFFYTANAYSQTSCDQYISSYTISQDVCNPKLVHFKNVNPSATGASWNFGDGATATGLQVSHEFNIIGEYDVKMVVEYPGGCTREVIKKIPVHITLDEELITTSDQTICPGEQVQLNSQSNNLDFCWLPADGLTDIKNRNPIVKPSVTTTYRLQNQLLGENLVKNPGFENGVTDFFSEYEARQITNFGEAQYWVTTNPQAWHSGFQPCGDHTSGTGNMMVVNGSPGINVVVWSQKVNVVPNTIYSFSLWIASVNPAAPAKLRFQINGNVLNQEVNAGDLACQWIQVYALWNSGTSTQAEITVINDNIIASGNDYALDDISFSTQSISYDEVTITVSPDAIIAGNDVTICEGASTQLNATGGTSYSWSPSEGLSNPNIGNPEASPLTTTTYTVTGTTDAGCTGTDEVTVTVNPKPIIDIGGNADICINNPYQVPGTVQGASVLSWSPATGLSDPAIANPIASPTVTTEYNLTATSDQGCVSEKSIVINVASSIDVTASADVTICEGTSTELTASGATKYSWSPIEGLSDPNVANPVASPATTTTYTVTGTSDLGCTGTAEVIVTVNALPIISLGEDAAYCEGGSYQIPGEATNATSISWSPSTGLSDATIANPIASPTSTTTYTITATNGQCTAEEEITINVAAALQVKTIDDLTICGDTTLELTTTTVAGGKYEWSPANGLSDPTVASPTATLTAGTHTYKVKVTSADGCEGTDEVTITVNDNPTIDVGEDAAYCVGGSYQIPGVATNATNINWSPATGLSDATIANPIASPTSTTTYTVTVTNGQCTAKEEITVNVAEALQVKTIDDLTICGDTTLELTTTTVAGGKYEWSPATGLSDPTIASPIATLTAGTHAYKVKVTSADGCEGTDEVTITVNANPAIDVGADAAYCVGGSYQIPGVATNATSISWSPAAGLSDATIANPLASPTSTTTYIVTATNGQCTAKDTITVNVAESLTINTISDTAICGGQASVELITTAVAGATYQWSPATGLSDVAISNPIASPTSTTKYVVTVTSDAGCTGTDSVTISMNDQPTVSAGADAAYCIGGSYQIPGVATNAASITWSPATGLSDATIANPLASPTSTTTYTVTATNGQCTAKDTITVNVAESLTINTISDTAICGGQASIELSTTAVEGATYKWSPSTGLSDPNIANPVAAPTSTTKYVVIVTSDAGCTGTDSVSISMNDQPTISIGADAAYCIGGSYQIPGVANKATSISWSPATGLSDAAIVNPIASPTTTTTYIVTAANGQCTAKDTLTVNVSESLTINTISDTAICGGQASIELTTTAVAGATYKWSPATGLSNPNIANPVASPTSTTKYVVTVTSASGCSGTDSVTISMNDQPTVSVGADAAYCIGGSYQIPGVVNKATNISWSPSSGLSDATIINPIASPKTTTTYIVTATNGICIAKDTMIVAVASSIQVTPINDTSVCAGNAVPLTGTLIQGATYQWTPSTGLSNTTIPNPMASPDKTTNYILTVSTPDGCQGKDSVLVTVAENPVITMNNDATVCLGETITLQAQSPGAKQYQWSPATGLSDPRNARPVATVNSTTTYSVTVTNTSGCESTDDVTITAAPLPTVNILKPNDIDCAHGDVQLQASGGASYQWSPAIGLDDPNSPNPIAKPASTTEYTVTATSVDGCEAEASVMVDVKAYPTETLNIPSAFTPNGDGLNDCFGLRTANLVSPFQFEVYNRWGQKVFETSNTSICWDGTFKGTAQPGDAFVWQIRVKGECGDTYKKGTVVLIR